MAGLYDSTPGFSDGTGLYRGRLGLFSGASGLVNGSGSSSSGLPADTLSEIWFGDNTDYSGRAARNVRASTIPTNDIMTYPADQIRSVAGGATLTYNYDGNGGTRVQIPALSTCQFIQTTAPGYSVLNGQPCAIGFQWQPTSGAQAFRFGQSTDYGSTSGSAAAFAKATKTWNWTNTQNLVITTHASSTIAAAPTGAVRDAFGVTTFSTGATAHNLIAGQSVTVTGVTDTTFNGTFTVATVLTTTTFTVPNAGAVATSGSGSVAKPVDIIVKELQVYEGASVPAWSAENFDYHAKSIYAFPNSWSTSTQSINNISPAVARTDVMFPTRTNYAEFTLFLAMEAGTTIPATDIPYAVPVYDPDHTPTVGANLWSLLGKGTTGRMAPTPDSQMQETGYYAIPGSGLQIYVYRAGPTNGVVQFVNELKLLYEKGLITWTNVDLYGHVLGADGSTRNYYPTTRTADAKYYAYAWVDREISDAEVKAGVAYIRDELAARSVTPTPLAITFCPGDSITERLNAVAWPYKGGADTSISPRFRSKVCAYSGTGFMNPAVLPYFQTVLTDEVLPGIADQITAGGRAIVGLLDGANDYAYLSKLVGQSPPTTIAGWDTAKAGWENYRDLCWIPYMQALRASDPTTKIFGFDTLAREDAVAVAANFETQGRGPWNTWKRANWATYCDGYIDMSASTLVDYATANAAGYYNVDKVHLSTTGQAYLWSTLIKPVWVLL